MSIVKLTEEQVVRLTRKSDREHVVSLVFGVGWLGLQDIPENQWAFDELTAPDGKELK